MSEQFEILLVDGSSARARIVREVVDEAGGAFHLTIASTGSEALDRLLERTPFEGAPRPDLIVLDLVLPGVTGLDLLIAIKTDARLRAIPVVVTALEPSPEDAHQCFEYGANSVVARPIALDALADLYRRLVAYWGRTNVVARDATRRMGS